MSPSSYLAARSPSWHFNRTSTGKTWCSIAARSNRRSTKRSCARQHRRVAKTPCLALVGAAAVPSALADGLWRANQARKRLAGCLLSRWLSGLRFGEDMQQHTPGCDAMRTGPMPIRPVKPKNGSSISADGGFPSSLRTRTAAGRPYPGAGSRSGGRSCRPRRYFTKA